MGWVRRSRTLRRGRETKTWSRPLPGEAEVVAGSQPLVLYFRVSVFSKAAGKFARGRERNMRTIFASVVVAGLLIATNADAAPLLSHSQPAPDSLITAAKVICDEAGNCYRPNVRRPVARWVYGDKNFYGPYDGPGNYGNPRYRYSWWPW